MSIFTRITYKILDWLLLPAIERNSSRLLAIEMAPYRHLREAMTDDENETENENDADANASSGSDLESDSGSPCSCNCSTCSSRNDSEDEPDDELSSSNISVAEAVAELNAIRLAEAALEPIASGSSMLKRKYQLIEKINNYNGDDDENIEPAKRRKLR